MLANFAAGALEKNATYRSRHAYGWIWGGLALAVVVGVAAAQNPIYGVGVVFVAAGALTIALRPGLAVWLLPLAPMLSGLARGVPIPGFRVSELIATGVGALVVIRGSMSPDSVSPKWRALDWAAFAYTAATILVSFGDVYIGGLPGTTLTQSLASLQYYFLYRAAVICLDTAARRVRALQVLLVSSTVTNVFAVLQALNVPGVRPFINQMIGLDPYLTPGYTTTPRATGLFPIWHVLAGFDVGIVLIVLALLLNHQRIMPLWLSLLTAALGVAGIAVSVTSTTAIGVIIGALTIGALTGRLRQVLQWSLLSIAAVGALIWPLITSRLATQGYGDQAGAGNHSLVPQTIAYRWQVWTQQYIPAIGERPLFGWGPQLPKSITWPYPENVYLSLLLRGGVVLLIVYVIWTVILFEAARRAHNSVPLDPADEVSRSVGTALMALLICLAIMQLLFPYLLNTGLPGMVWIMGAMVVRYQAAPPPRPDERVKTAADRRAAQQRTAEAALSR